MSMLEGFKPFNFTEGVPSFSLTPNGITFNRSVVMKLGYPEFVLLLIDAEGKRVAVQSCTEDTANSMRFFKEKKSNVISVRWNGRDLLNTLERMMGWDLKKSSYRVEGTVLPEENAVLFDLTRAGALK